MKIHLRNNFRRLPFQANIILISLLFFISVYFQRTSAGENYFQQEVDYNIKVDLDPGTAKLVGIETITYKNNSPDTLGEIYFHLFFNAFQPGSYLDMESRRQGDFDIANVSKKRMGFVNIDVIKIDDLETANYIIDNTIMKVPLIDPLEPGGIAVIYIEFTSQIPARGSRTARSGKHFDVGQWYPKPVVYDRYGWHDHQYMDYEFYGEFADFHVELTIPSNFIVAHMGELLNEEEIYGSKLPIPEGDSILVDVLSGLEMEKESESDSAAVKTELAESDYEDVDGDDETSTEPDTIKSDAELKTWKFEAKNVHDFSFCADPAFILDLCKYNDVTVKAYYTKSNKKIWQRKAAHFTRKAMKYLSEKHIPYPYGQYSTVSSLTGGGMEYPQLTMVSRRSGSRGEQYLNFESLIAHEVAHAWFYGILGFNETEQGFLDEGLTTLSDIEYMEHFYGRRHNNFRYKYGWQRKLLPNGDERNDIQKRYIRRAIEKDEDPMKMPANQFRTYGHYYNTSYYKAASVYMVLQYMLGDDKFDLFLSRLFEKWKFKHPYLSDVKKIAEELYGSNLDWFFRQWFTTTWRLDYALKSVKYEKSIKNGNRGYNTTISINNNERCVSPLDIVLYYNRDISDTINISHTVWLDGQDSYDTTLFLRAKPEKVTINPDRRLPDINMLNNSTGFPHIQWQFMVPQFIYNDNYIEHYVESYTIAHRPLLWYNARDGVDLGYRVDGSHLGVTRNIELEGWFGLHSGRFNYVAGFDNPLFFLNPNVDLYLKSREMDGRGEQRFGARLERDDSDYDISIRRYYVYDSKYIYGDNWSAGEIYSMDADFNHLQTYRFSKLDLGLSAAVSIRGSDYDFSRILANFEFELLDILGNNTRIKLRAGLAEGEVPVEKRFFLSSADPLEIWNSPLYRSKGTLPDSWKDDGRLLMPGGGELYGYYKMGNSGKKILSGKLERDLPAIKLPFSIPVVSSEVSRISSQLYVGSGLTWDDSGDFEPRDFIHEAGLAFSYGIPFVDKFMGENKIKLYLPLWLSDPFENRNKFDFRWIVGLSP